MNKLIASVVFAFVLFTTSATAGNALFDAAIRSVDKKFSYYDKEVKKAKYGNKQWEKRVASKRQSLDKALKKVAKKWPNENIDAQWVKLKSRDETYKSNSVKAINVTATVIPTQVKTTNKVNKPPVINKPVKKQDPLYKYALKSVNDKLSNYDKLLAQKKYGRNNWFAQLDKSKKVVLKAIKQLEDKWPDESTKVLHDSLAQREETLQNSTYNFVVNIVKKRFKSFDNMMSENLYGQAKWDTLLKKNAKDLNNAISYLAKKWPTKAESYRTKFRQRVATVKQKMAMVQAKKKVEIAKQQKAQKETKVTAPKAKLTISTSKTLLAKVKKDQAEYKNNGKIKVWGNSTGWSEQTDGQSAYLSFSNSFEDGAKEKLYFTGKDFIYAQLHLPKTLTSLLPDENAKGMSYYKVTLVASVKNESVYVNDKTQKNANRLEKKADFKLGYNTKNLKLAVVPEKAFFENVLESYKTAGKFEDTKTEEQALSDLLSRNFSRQMSNLFKKLPLGNHQVVMEFQVLAKLQSANYVELKNMKGTFLLTIDQEAKDRYENTFNMLSKLYRKYESQHNIAVSGLDLDAEKKRIANMSPRERERYNIAKISATGYMAAYGGERAKVTFSLGPLRTKNAYIDIVWNKGSCAKCEEGSTSVVVRKTASKSFNIPLGARVTLNGRTLINNVNAKKHVPLYWHY